MWWRNSYIFYNVFIILICTNPSNAAFGNSEPFASKTLIAKKQRTNSALQSSGGAIPEKDYSPQFSGMLGNLRIPSSLFAGASAGAAFAMPIAASDSLKLGLVKRIYALLMITSLASQLLVIVVSTITMNHISRKGGGELAASTTDFIEKFYMLEWVATKIHFFGGVLAFVIGAGLRAWVTITCPVVAKAALGVMASGVLLSTSFMDASWRDGGDSGILQLPFQYLSLLFKRSRTSVTFAVSFLLNIVTFLYIMGNIPHVYNFLAP